MISHKTIYYTSDHESVSNLITSKEDRSVPSFIKLNLRTGSYKRYSRPQFHASLLKQFLFTSPLNFPEVFSSELLGELIGQGIPILAILQTEFNDTKIVDYLAPVDFCLSQFRNEIQSGMAVVKFTNPEHSQQGPYFRYCEKDIVHAPTICIIESKPTMKRYVMQAAFPTRELVEEMVKDYLAGKLKEYLKMEHITDIKEGAVLVDWWMMSRT